MSVARLVIEIAAAEARVAVMNERKRMSWELTVFVGCCGAALLVGGWVLLETARAQHAMLPPGADRAGLWLSGDVEHHSDSGRHVRYGEKTFPTRHLFWGAVGSMAAGAGLAAGTGMGLLRRRNVG